MCVRTHKHTSAHFSWISTCQQLAVNLGIHTLTGHFFQTRSKQPGPNVTGLCSEAVSCGQVCTSSTRSCHSIASSQRVIWSLMPRLQMLQQCWLQASAVHLSCQSVCCALVKHSGTYNWKSPDKATLDLTAVSLCCRYPITQGADHLLSEHIIHNQALHKPHHSAVDLMQTDQHQNSAHFIPQCQVKKQTEGMELLQRCIAMVAAQQQSLLPCMQQILAPIVKACHAAKSNLCQQLSRCHLLTCKLVQPKTTMAR